LALCCLSTLPFRLCCDEEIDECFEPWTEKWGFSAGAFFGSLPPAFCCVDVCSPKVLREKDVYYKTRILRVGNSELAARTLFGEAQAIREMQQRLGLNQQASRGSAPPAMQMQ